MCKISELYHNLKYTCDNPLHYNQSQYTYPYLTARSAFWGTGQEFRCTFFFRRTATFEFSRFERRINILTSIQTSGKIILEKFQKQMKTNQNYFEERQQTRRFFAEYFYFLELEEISRIFFNRYGLNEIQTKWSDTYQPRRNLLVYKMDCYCFE